MLLGQAARRSTVKELERRGFDPLKANDSSFDSVSHMGSYDPYGTYIPAAIILAEERQYETDDVNNID